MIHFKTRDDYMDDFSAAFHARQAARDKLENTRKYTWLGRITGQLTPEYKRLLSVLQDAMDREYTAMKMHEWLSDPKRISAAKEDWV